MARSLNGTNQFFRLALGTGGFRTSNRTLGFGGYVRFDGLRPNTAVALAELGDPTSTAGNSRVRITWDGAAGKLLASTGGVSGAGYREKSIVPLLTADAWFFVALLVDEAGEPRLFLNQVEATTATGTVPPAGNPCQLLVLGGKALTTPTQFAAMSYHNWFWTSGFLPSDSQIDLLRQGADPALVFNGPLPAGQNAYVWPMVQSGTTEASTGSPATLTANNAPLVTSAPNSNLAFGAFTLPAIQAGGVIANAPRRDATGGVTLPMIQAGGAAGYAAPTPGGRFTIPMIQAGGAATYAAPPRAAEGGVTLPMFQVGGRALFAGSGTRDTTFYISSFTNTGSVPSWDNQALHLGLPVIEGEVPAGFRVVAYVNGAEVRTQLSGRETWNDGSLKYAEATITVPTISPDQTIAIEWRRRAGSFDADDTALHATPSAINNHLNAEWRAASFKYRPTTTSLGEEIGPIRFPVSDFFAGANLQWVKTLAAGPVMSEWQASVMGRMPDGTRHPNFGAKIYARAIGGTPGNPDYIEFGFASMYAWSDNAIPADQTGYRVSWDLLVNGTVRRGVTNGDTAQIGVNGFKGGTHFSFGPTGKMDWYDVKAAQFVTPPALVHRHDIQTLIRGKFLAPADLSNAIDTTPAKRNILYAPNGRGPVAANMSDVADRDDITWTHTGWTFRAMLAHRLPAAETAEYLQTCRAAALAVGSIPCQGYVRSSRVGTIPHLPSSYMPNEPALGATLYGTKVENAAAAWTPYITLDDSHFPQLAYFTALLEGDAHIRQLLYAEAVAPGLFVTNDQGFATTISAGGVSVQTGGVSIKSQIRGTAHCGRQIAQAVGLGRSGDPEWKYLSALLTNFTDAVRMVPLAEDQWRGGTTYRDNFIYFSQNDPQMKIWMHTLVLHGMSAMGALTQREDVKDTARWFARMPKVAMGGHNDGADPTLWNDVLQSTLDENTFALAWGDGTGVSRQAFRTQQWGTPQTIAFEAGGTITRTNGFAVNGWVITPYSSAIPSGLTRGKAYWTVQADGVRAKLSETPGGEPVTWDVAATATAIVRGTTPPIPSPTNSLNGNQTNGFGLQMIAAMKGFYHFIGPDPVARKAIQATERYKTAGGYAEKAKWSIPFVDEDAARLSSVVYLDALVIHQGAQVMAPDPAGTMRGGVTIPMIQAGGAALNSDLPEGIRGGVTIPMIEVAGAIEAGAVSYAATGAVTLPMIVGAGTGQVRPPATASGGGITIPMIQVTGAAINAPMQITGRAILPPVEFQGAATVSDPAYAMSGGVTLPAVTFTGFGAVTGAPADGNFVIPMVVLAGSATSEQFAYEAAGNFDIPMLEFTGEGIVSGFDLNGGVTIPMFDAAGSLEMFVPGVEAKGSFTLPMIRAGGTMSGEVPVLLAEGYFVLPMPVLSGETEARRAQEFSGDFTLPAFVGGDPTLRSRWTPFPTSAPEIWTVTGPDQTEV